MTRAPLRNPPRGVRQRMRADGSWRLWWEPNAKDRARGARPVELDPTRPDWSAREADRLNAAHAPEKNAPEKKAAGGRTIAALIDNYRRHVLPKLKPGTQSGYRTLLGMVGRKWGGELVVSFSKPIMNEWFETLQATGGPQSAVKQIAMMSNLFTRAEKIGWRAENSNPCFNLGRMGAARRKRAASWAEVAALEAAALDCGLVSIGHALRLSLFQGQRRSCVIDARLDEFRVATIRTATAPAPFDCLIWDLERRKRGTQTMLPVHAECAPFVTARLADGDDGAAHLIIEDRLDRPYDPDLFAKRWSEVRARAARTAPSVLSRDPARQLQFRDLRRTLSATARNLGLDKADIAAVLGNSADVNPQLGDTYMPPSFDAANRVLAAMQRPKGKGITNLR